MSGFALDDLQPVRGAIHVHSAYDDGTASVLTLREEADAAGLAYLIVTDHHVPFAARDGWVGRGPEGGTLLQVGVELETAERTEILALGVSSPVATRGRDSEEALALLARLGSVSFIPHPQGYRPLGLWQQLPPWREWDLATYAGIEIWSYMHDWVQSFRRPWRLPAMCRNPEAFLTGPDPAVLAAWDAQARRRRVAGIGALDSHGARLPLGAGRVFRWGREGILPYRQNFRALSHHALVPRGWGASDVHDGRALNMALAEGRGWVCHEALAPGAELRYFLIDDDVLRPVGTETAFHPGQEIVALSPTPARLRLLCRGEAVAETAGTELRHQPAAPGEYRLEGWLERQGRCQPWVFTNHIYLREPRRAPALP